MSFLAVLIVAVSTACNPLIAVSNDAGNLSMLRNEMGHSGALASVSAVSVKGRLAVVKDAASVGPDATKWTKAGGPGPVMSSVWTATYTRTSPRDPYRTFTFVEVLNAAGQHLVTLPPPGC